MNSIFTNRETKSLNGVWQFAFNEDNDWNDEGVSAIQFNDFLSVPSAFDAMPAYNGKRGIGFYRRQIEIPAGCRGRLYFNAVGMYAKVFVDNEKLAEQYAAYTPFTVDIPASPQVERELIVMVGNRFNYEIYPLHEIFFDFYAYGGIFRDVELHMLPEGPLVEWVGVDTLDYRQGKIRVKVKTKAPSEKLKCLLDGQTSLSGKFIAVAEGEYAAEYKVNCELWTPEHPELHTISVDNGFDCLSVRFGLRQVRAEDGKILLNGRPVKLLGYCRHEAHPQYGPALPLSQLVADLQLLRDLGCNFIRGTHYQQDPRFLDLCDEMGFLVFEESMGWQPGVKHLTDPRFVTAQLAQTSAMIASSYNHPSVILRGFLNEGDSEHEESRACYEALIQLLRQEDPHRLVTYASNHGLNDLFLDQVDVVCFNTYPGWYASDRNDEKPLGEIIPQIHHVLDGLEQRRLSNKPFVISEIGAGALYGWRDPICAHWSEEYQREYLKIVCEEVVNNPRITGVSLWQFYDCRTYRGSCSLTRPRAFNNKGTLDEYRRPKLAYETVKRIFREYKNCK